MTDNTFVLMIQITKITKKHAKIQFYYDSQKTINSSTLKKIFKELLSQIYLRDWSSVLHSDLKQLKQSKSPSKANLNGFGRELTPDFKAHVSKTGHLLEGANNKQFLLSAKSLQSPPPKGSASRIVESEGNTSAQPKSLHQLMKDKQLSLNVKIDGNVQEMPR